MINLFIFMIITLKIILMINYYQYKNVLQLQCVTIKLLKIIS